MTIREIADEIGITRDLARKIWRRAMAKLAALIDRDLLPTDEPQTHVSLVHTEAA